MLKLKKVKNPKTGKLVDITVTDEGQEIIEPSIKDETVRGKTTDRLYYDEADHLDEDDLKVILPLIKEADKED